MQQFFVVPSTSMLGCSFAFLYCECFLQRARDLYFKDWDPARNPLPDNRQVSYHLYDVDL